VLDQIITTIILGIVQGLTEWLPISSSGHLVILEHFFGLATTPLFDVVLHVGTLAVVVFFFRKEVKSILSALGHLDFKSEYGRLIPVIVAATIPTGIIGLIYARYLEDSLQTILIIGITFIIGATLVYTSKLGRENTDTVAYSTAVIMGFAQGFAAFHGLSRSGATISTALLLGLKREKAFRFSFLLSIPAIIGDLLVEAYKQRGQISTSGIGWPELLIGTAVAALVGYVALTLLSRMVASRRFHYFAFYTWPLGVALVILALSGF
jgi:undecaprenyl-diphosphatase